MTDMCCLYVKRSNVVRDIFILQRIYIDRQGIINLDGPSIVGSSKHNGYTLIRDNFADLVTESCHISWRRIETGNDLDPFRMVFGQIFRIIRDIRFRGRVKQIELVIPSDMFQRDMVYISYDKAGLHGCIIRRNADFICRWECNIDPML